MGSHQRSQDLVSHSLIHLVKRSVRMIIVHEENTFMHFMIVISMVYILIFILHHPYSFIIILTLINDGFSCT